MSPGALQVLFVTGMYPAPWHETHGSFVHESARALCRRGVHVEVIRAAARRPPLWPGGRRPVPEERTLDGIRVRYVLVPRPPGSVLLGRRAPLMRPVLSRAVRAARSERPFDLVHAHQVIPIGYAALPAARDLGLPMVCTAHGGDIYRDPRNAACRRQAAWVIEASDQVVAVSRDLAEQCERLAAPARKVVAVPNGVDLDLFRPIPAEEARRELGLDRSPRVLYVGNLVSEKGVLDLMEAFALMARGHAGARLVYAGSGPLRKALARMSRELGIGDRVDLLGARPREEIPLWMSASAVCVLPSRSESFGIAALEAMACARAVVASRVGGLPELIQDGVTGRLTPPGDPASLASAIGGLLAEPVEAARLEAAAREWVLGANLTWEDHAERLASLYREVIASRGISAC